MAVVQATIPDHFPVLEVSVSLNQGTLSLLESETKPVGRLILDATLQVPCLTPLSTHELHQLARLVLISCDCCLWLLLLLLQLVRRPHSWSLDAALGALEVFDLDPQAQHRTVATTRRTAAAGAAPMMKVGREGDKADNQAWTKFLG